MLEIKPPAEDDRSAIAALGGLAFNYQPSADQIALEGKYCAYEDGRLVAMATALPFGQWFGGRQARCAGVGGVAVAPEHRGRGLASQVMGTLLRAQRAAGDVISTLYPANAQLYRKLGYDYGGLRPELTAPIAHLPAGRAGAVSLVGDEAGPALMACFSRFAAGHNGPIEATQTSYFTGRLLAWSVEGLHQRTVAVPGVGGIDGYASYFTTPRDARGDYRVSCKHLVACTAAAHKALLAYFAGFDNAAMELSWFGPPNMPVMGQALSTNSFSVRVNISRWMTRALDVRGALEARGYPMVDGHCSLAVRDDLFPDNEGPWSLSAEGGRVRVVASDDPGGKALAINAFSALYTGQATPADLVLAGEMEGDDPRLGFLSSLFAGPAPWMPDFF